jgi:hypothetical protein
MLSDETWNELFSKPGTKRSQEEIDLDTLHEQVLQNERIRAAKKKRQGTHKPHTTHSIA